MSRFVFVILIHLATLMASPSTLANEKVTFQLRWHHQFQLAGYYMALEKGYYDSAGIDVLIQQVGEGKDHRNCQHWSNQNSPRRYA